jgi:hypothetical protein
MLPRNVFLLLLFALVTFRSHADDSYRLWLKYDRMGQRLHDGSQPWPNWPAIYYHKGDSLGLRFNSTGTDSNVQGLYQPQVDPALFTDMP